MRKPPTVQSVSAAYAERELLLQPNGTYIVRAPTANDNSIEACQLTLQSKTSSFVVLSVRVDERAHQCSIKNYHLVFDGQDSSHLLDVYEKTRKNGTLDTSLIDELLLKDVNPSWHLDPSYLTSTNHSRGQFGGKNNAGAFKALYHRSQGDPLKVFVKLFPKGSTHFTNELTLLKNICFFPIITLVGQYADDEYSYLVFTDGGKSLKKFCPIRCLTRRSTMLKVTNIGFQIANAMAYLEKKNIVHRDLTASNVLWDRTGFIRIADFGHAIQKQEGQNHLQSSASTDNVEYFLHLFLAPECFIDVTSDDTDGTMAEQRYASFSSKSDVWSFGILMIQLMLDKPSIPYPNVMGKDDIRTHVKIERQVHPQPLECNLDVYEALKACWQYKPIDRPCFVEVRDTMMKLMSTYTEFS